ncbi:MAG: sensor histidine kinase [Clostridia bacterium]|nr:sensor histidine kinase [Clostridia bacterium]
MGAGKFKSEVFARLFIISMAASGTVWGNADLSTSAYMALMLLFIINSQVRVNFLRDKLIIISIFVDLGLIYYLNNSYTGLSYLLLLVTILDSLTLLQGEAYIIITIILGMLGYFIKSKSIESVFLITAVFVIAFVFAMQLKKLHSSFKEVEELYDQNRKYSYQVEDAKKRLEEYMKKIESVSQLEERNRISQEIHDTLGHKLTGVLMQLDAAIRVAEVDSEKGKHIIYSVRENMEACVEILRQTVRNINPKDYTNRILSIQQMIEDFRRATGIDVTFSIAGAPVKLYPSAEIALYKNCQEAITNAVRHGNAKKIEVVLKYLEKSVEMTVKDDGSGCKEVINGIGIKGMEERVSLLGGKLMISAANGFEVRTVIPVSNECI